MAKYKLTYLGDLSWFLGIQVTQGKDAVLLSKLLGRFGMQDCKPIKTPTAENFKNELNSSVDLINDSERQIYQILIGSFMCPVIGTRPEIASAIEKPSKFFETLSKASG